MSKVISFPHMGNYSIPVKYLLSHITNSKILIPPNITNKTIEIGNKHSPNFVCTPFKYTLGTYIEALEQGANILVQAGGGCRYGYYSELQIKILEDLGYKFKYINLVSKGKKDLRKIYKSAKETFNDFKLIKSLYYLFITSKMIKYMDKVDDYIRENIGFEIEKDSFKKANKKMLKSFSNTLGYFDLRKKYKEHFNIIKKIQTNKPKDCLKIGIIGELYTIMEPFSNYYLETELAKYGIEVKRFTNVNYLLFEKGKKIKSYLKTVRKYIKYKMGADAADNIARAKYLCASGYDGIIHIKSSFCTPEIGAMSIINKICKEYNVPVMFFSFDINTSEVGIKTRLEAFYDMIEMRKNNEKLLSRN